MVDLFFNLIAKQEESLRFVQRVIKAYRGNDAMADFLAETVEQDIEQLITIIQDMKKKLCSFPGEK